MPWLKSRLQALEHTSPTGENVTLPAPETRTDSVSSAGTGSVVAGADTGGAVAGAATGSVVAGAATGESAATDAAGPLPPPQAETEKTPTSVQSLRACLHNAVLFMSHASECAAPRVCSLF